MSIVCAHPVVHSRSPGRHGSGGQGHKVVVKARSHQEERVTTANDRGCSLEAVGLAFVIGGLAEAAVVSVVGAAVGS